jgi:hypothetical protein
MTTSDPKQGAAVPEASEKVCLGCGEPVTSCECCPGCDGEGYWLPAGACGGCDYCPTARRCDACNGTGKVSHEQ